MQKLLTNIFVLFLIVSNFFGLQSRDQHDIHAYLSVSPTPQGDQGAYARANSYASGSNYKAPQFSFTCNFQNDFYYKPIKVPSVEQFQKSRKSFNYGSSVYKLALLASSGSVGIAGKIYPVVKEDYDLIDKICRDNPHYDRDKLWKQLLYNGSINHAAILMKDYKPGYFVKNDVYINQNYFSSLIDAIDRLSLWKAAALDGITQRHKVEKNNIESRHKAELQKAKKISKSEQKKVEQRHKEELAKFDTQKKYAIDHWNGVKPVQSKAPSQHNVVSQKILQQLNDQQQSIKNKINQSKYAYDASFVKVIAQREQALQQSLANPNITLQKFSIPPHVIGFLQAQGIDTAQFQQIKGLQIQHQFAHELVDVLDEVAQYAMHHYDEKDLIAYCAQLAQATQQANHEAALVQAVQGTNCCHGITHYLKGLVSGVGQAYQQFQNALDYFETVVDSYGALIVQHAAHGALIAHGLEGIVAAGMIAAPTATVAATGIMIGATAYVMAPVCMQGMINIGKFSGACIMGNWDKVISDLDNFGQFVSSKETVARIAEFAGGAAVSMPNFNYVVDQVLSLRPVLTRVQNEAGQTISKLYVMSKNRVQQVYQQSVELLQSRDFLNFNLMYEKILGCHFFDILSLSHPALAGAFSGLESGVLNLAEQTMMTQLFTQADSAVAGEVIKNEVIHAVYPLVENINQPVFFVQNIVQKEIQQALQQGNKTIGVDLFTPITISRASELADLSTTIRQLQDLAKYTNNFQNLNELIPQDIAYLNRIYELQPYRAQIKNFLDTHKPYFMHDGQQYFIEDIASYHIHAGDYYCKDAPKGGHSNYGGHQLDCFKLKLIKNGPLGTKKVTFYNPRLSDVTKDSSIYPEAWPEYICDLKAIEVMTSGNTEIEVDLIKGIINFEGCTSEGLNIRIGYDIKTKRIKTHYPKFD